LRNIITFLKFTFRSVVRKHFADSSNAPLDESLLNTLGCTFKQCKAEREFIDLYEFAIKSTSETKLYSESVFLELFYTYARNIDIKGMHFTAQRMYKLLGVKKFMCWTVGCMMLELQMGELPNTMILVAEKMMAKYRQLQLENTISNHALGSEERLLYSFILLRLHKYSDSLQLLPLPNEGTSNDVDDVRIMDAMHLETNSNLVSSHPLNRRTHRIDILLRQYVQQSITTEADSKGTFQQIGDEIKQLLVCFPDQWNMHKLLVEHTLLSSTQTTFTEGQSSTSYLSRTFPNYDLTFPFYKSTTPRRIDIEAVIIHQRYLREMQESYPYLRGPFLAEIHLVLEFIHFTSEPTEALLLPAKSYIDSNNILNSQSIVLNLICAYLWRFRFKQCCFSDTKGFIALACRFDVEFTTQFMLWLESKSLELHDVLINCVNETNNANTLSTLKLEPVENVTADDEEEEKVEEDNTKVSSVVELESIPNNAAPKKKKPKKKKKKKSASTAANSNPLLKEKKTDVNENSQVILDICAYSKFTQVFCFCRLLLAKIHKDSPTSMPPFSEVALRLKMYKSLKPLFVNGVGGEVRNVQPGDELILENSSFFRRVFYEYAGSELRGVLVAIRWSQCLFRGMEASPFSYGFKVDILEPLRILAAAQPTLVAFNGLKAKYIQVYITC